MAYSPGHQLFDPAELMAGGGLHFHPAVSARAGGGRALATPLRAAYNQLAVVAAAGNSVALPPAVGGQSIFVFNATTNAAQVFAAVGTTDTINGVAAATGIALAPSAAETFISPAPGVWIGSVVPGP